MNRDLFNNKYRIESCRLKNWDYGSNAAYFLTICTLKKEHFFGIVHNDEMVLNEFGLLVQYEWERTPSVRPDMNLTLGEYVVMPNHFHGIICIGENEFNKQHRPNKFGPQSKNMGAVIGGFKSTLTTQIRKSDTAFAWQERYHDHIIRDEKEYEMIRQYIINNPANWKEDTLYK